MSSPIEPFDFNIGPYLVYCEDENEWLTKFQAFAEFVFGSDDNSNSSFVVMFAGLMNSFISACLGESLAQNMKRFANKVNMLAELREQNMKETLPQKMDDITPAFANEDGLERYLQGWEEEKLS